MDGGSAVPPPAHVVLRESTRTAHEAAEASPAMQRLLSGALDEAGYLDLLALQRGLFRDWEERRDEWLASNVTDAGWHYVSRADRLTADLGEGPKRLRSVREPLQRQTLAMAGSHEAWGELYVLEGSALGGRLILKHLRQRFPALPHRFYAIGEDADVSWPRFQAVLDRALAEPAALHAAIEGALGMFARFQQTLQDDPAHV